MHIPLYICTYLYIYIYIHLEAVLLSLPCVFCLVDITDIQHSLLVGVNCDSPVVTPGLNFIQCHTFANPSASSCPSSSGSKTLGKALVAKKNFDVGELEPWFFLRKKTTPDLDPPKRGAKWMGCWGANGSNVKQPQTGFLHTTHWRVGISFQKHLKMDGWNTECDPFLLGRDIFRGELLVLWIVSLLANYIATYRTAGLSRETWSMVVKSKGISEKIRGNTSLRFVIFGNP